VSFLKLHNDRIPLVQDLYILASQSSQAHSARNHNTYDARSNTHDARSNTSDARSNPHDARSDL